MSISFRRRRLMFGVSVAMASVCGALLAFSSGPPPGRTGDFGEPTCGECHTGNPLNAAGGVLSIDGVPDEYVPGQTYPLTVTISKSGQSRWGFQLSSRNIAGQQAGTLKVTDAARTLIQSRQSGVQYISHSSGGTSPGASQGLWTFNWIAPATDVGEVIFSAAGNAANGNFSNSGDFIYTTSLASIAASAPITGLFAQVAVGAGYETIFTLVNTGSDSLTGTLILTSSDGTPMDVRISSPVESDSVADPPVFASSLLVSIGPGGSRILTASASGLSEPMVGWARLETTGGLLDGVATFQLQGQGLLQTAVGVLASDLGDVFTIPINDDAAQSRRTGYAVANPTGGTIRIRLHLVDPNGVVIMTIDPLPPLESGRHRSRFFSEDLDDPNFKFQGTAVLETVGGEKFTTTALILDRGLFTAVPVIAGKAPGIGN